MNEYSQKIYDLLIEKAKDIVAQGFFEKEIPELPNIFIKYSEIPKECWEQGETLKSIEKIRLSRTNEDDEDIFYFPISSISVSNAKQMLRISLSPHVWQELINARSKK